jgi:CheY-like chemotaxis protein
MPEILIIDDDPDWCEGSLRTPLLPLEYQITTERDRSQAFRLVRKIAFDLVILNVRLDFQIRDDKITSQWTELLDLIRQRGTEVIVVTSQSFPTHIQLHTLLRMAFKDFDVTDFLIKEEFNAKEYREIVRETIERRRPEIQRQNPLSLHDREELIRRLANEPIWKTGQYLERMGLLLATGLPGTYVQNLALNGAPSTTAALVISGLEQIGFVEGAPDYRAVGLLVKYLHQNCPEVEGKRFLAQIIIRYHMTTDQAWVTGLDQDLAPTS